MRSANLAIAAVLFAAAFAHGQESRPAPPATRKQDLLDAADKLRQAKGTGTSNKAAEGLADKLPSDLTKAAKSAMESKEDTIDALRSAAGTLLPQAQKLMRGGDAPSAAPSPGASPPPGQADAPPAPGGPRPMPLQPLAEPMVAGLGKATTVTINSDDAVFDLKAGVFIYRGHVRARHPQFYIECAELEVHMVVEDPDAPPKTEAKDDPIMAKPPKPSKGKDGGKEETSKQDAIKKAVARGPMVTIEKVSEQGEVQQGKCRQAIYDAATGEIVMSDHPQVLRGNVLQVATSPSTTMTFDQKGKLTTSGPSKTDILSASDSSLGLPGESAPGSKSKGR